MLANLLYRSLRFSDRNSIIDCNFGNTWRVFRAKLIDKVARTLFHSLLLFLLREICPISFINELDLTANNEYSGRVASFNSMWQERYTPLNFC